MHTAPPPPPAADAAQISAAAAPPPAAYPSYPAYPPPSYPPPVAPSSYPPPYTYPYAPYPYPSPQEVQRRKAVDRTKSGLLMMAVGFLLAWLPYVSGIGGLLLLVGAVLVILGRAAFGTRHSTLVVAGASLVFVGLLAGGVLAGWFATALLTEPLARVAPAFLAGVLGVTALVAIAVVLFLYGLADALGRLLLYGALVFAVGVPALVVAVYLGGGVPLFSDVETYLDIAAGPANVFFAMAALRSWSRINRGEVRA